MHSALLRRRGTAKRKWTVEETVKLLTYLRDTIDEFEKPNARCYYVRFLSKTGYNIEPNIVRGKVRNMRVSYQKALCIKNTQANDPDNNDERTTECAIRRMCPFFNMLDEIFATMEPIACQDLKKIIVRVPKPKPENTTPEFTWVPESSGNSMFFENEATQSMDGINNDESQYASQDDNQSYSPEHVDIIHLSEPSPKRKATKTLNTLKRSNSSNSITDSAGPVQKQRLQLMQTENDFEREKVEVEKQRLEFGKQKLEFEKQKFEMTLAFDKQKFEMSLAFEKRKFEMELATKKEQMVVDERIKMAEIRSKEKAAIMEIQLKYKVKNLTEAILS